MLISVYYLVLIPNIAFSIDTFELLDFHMISMFCTHTELAFYIYIYTMYFHYVYFFPNLSSYMVLFLSLWPFFNLITCSGQIVLELSDEIQEKQNDLDRESFNVSFKINRNKISDIHLQYPKKVHRRRTSGKNSRIHRLRKDDRIKEKINYPHLKIQTETFLKTKNTCKIILHTCIYKMQSKCIILFTLSAQTLHSDPKQA